MPMFIATVQLYIESGDADAVDGVIDNILSEYDMADGTLLDWRYLKIGNQRLTAVRDRGLPGTRSNKTVCIHVGGGVVEAVGGLPPGWDFEIIDED